MRLLLCPSREAVTPLMIAKRCPQATGFLGQCRTNEPRHGLPPLLALKAREHQVLLAVIARSFARIHEPNLK